MEVSSQQPQEKHDDGCFGYRELPLELWHLIYQYLPRSDLFQGALVAPIAVGKSVSHEEYIGDASTSTLLKDKDKDKEKEKGKDEGKNRPRGVSLSLYCQSQIWCRINVEDWDHPGLQGHQQPRQQQQQQQQQQKEQQPQGLLRNASLIRRLSCSPRTRLLDQLSHEPTCCFLTHLDLERVSFLNAAILDRLLSKNAKGIQSLRLKLDRVMHFQTLVKYLPIMTELRELYLQHWAGITQESVAIVLENCPQVETLSLGYNSLYPFTFENLAATVQSSSASVSASSLLSDSLEPEEIGKDRDVVIDLFNSSSSSSAGSMNNLSPMPLFKIRSLILNEAIIFHESLVLNLCSRCPDLESLSMQGCFGLRLSNEFITRLAKLCPRLCSVNFTNQSTTERFYKTLFNSLQRLEQVKVSGTTITDEDIQLLVQHSGTTVKEIEIRECTSLGSKSVLAILMGCSDLKRLDTRGVELNPREMMEPTDEWCCHKSLQTLYLDIQLPKRLYYAQGEVTRIQRKLYEQLAQCYSLLDLQLGAGSRDRGVNILTMSLGTGLELLSTLKRLERLEIKRLSHSVRATEMHWMVRQWPRLKALGILLDTALDKELVIAIRKLNHKIAVW
ncbi:hypothetical protein BGZ94_009932 [Podila epigama]|nr:hypothetical protein BGZ94_009932 [Podila epigama]